MDICERRVRRSGPPAALCPGHDSIRIVKIGRPQWTNSLPARPRRPGPAGRWRHQGWISGRLPRLGPRAGGGTSPRRLPRPVGQRPCVRKTAGKWRQPAGTRKHGSSRPWIGAGPSPGQPWRSPSPGAPGPVCPREIPGTEETSTVAWNYTARLEGRQDRGVNARISRIPHCEWDRHIGDRTEGRRGPRRDGRRGGRGRRLRRGQVQVEPHAPAGLGLLPGRPVPGGRLQQERLQALPVGGFVTTLPAEVALIPQPLRMVPDLPGRHSHQRASAGNTSRMAWSDGFMSVLPSPVLQIRRIGR